MRMPKALATRPSTSSRNPRSAATPVNLNKTGIDQLESSLEFSKAEAEAIVHFRQQNGDFNTVQQLLSLPGVDADKIKKDKKEIVF
jgi:competence protein ComEA